MKYVRCSQPCASMTGPGTGPGTGWRWRWRWRETMTTLLATTDSVSSLLLLDLWIMQFLTKIPHGRLTGHGKGHDTHTHTWYTHTRSQCKTHTYSVEGKSLIVSLLLRYRLQIVCVCVLGGIFAHICSVCVCVCAIHSAYAFYMAPPHTSFVKLDKRHLAFCNQQNNVTCRARSVALDLHN